MKSDSNYNHSIWCFSVGEEVWLHYNQCPPQGHRAEQRGPGSTPGRDRQGAQGCEGFRGPLPRYSSQSENLSLS